MTGIFTGFINDILSDAATWLNDNLISNLDIMLRVEQMLTDLGTPITAATVEKAYQYIYTLVVSLLVLKFLFKGFSIYILWRDGDADSSPQDMLIGTLQAAVTIIAFPFLYNILADVTIEFAQGIMPFFGVAPGSDPGLGGILTVGTLGLWELLIMLIYLIMLAVLYVVLMKRGFELMVLRLGIPFACMGLIDSDYGIFKSYIQILFKTLITSVIQIVLLSMSMPVVLLGHPIVGIAIISTAFATPQILQQILISTGRGGGLTQKIYAGSMLARAVGMLRR